MIVLLVATNLFTVRESDRVFARTIDISTLLHNLAVAGALCAARTQGILFCDGYQSWKPGCGRQCPRLHVVEAPRWEVEAP